MRQTSKAQRVRDSCHVHPQVAMSTPKGQQDGNTVSGGTVDRCAEMQARRLGCRGLQERRDLL